MAKASLAALLLVSAAAFAQNPPAPAPAKPAQPTPSVQPAPAPEQPAAKPPAATPEQPAASAQPAPDAIQKEIDAKVAERVEQAKKELREEIRKQQQAAQGQEGWKEEVSGERRKLELFVLNGYLRVRPDLFENFNLGRGWSPLGPTTWLWPPSSTGFGEKTEAGVNMRFRFEPTLNVSEEVRIHTQIDALDNLVWGSTARYAFTGDPRLDYILFDESQSPPTSGVNSWKDSIHVRRAYGEVSTPVGIFRFGRMGLHWGLGILENDGNCLDCDYGETVDRFQFVVEPYAGWYIAPMIDFNFEGPTSGTKSDVGQPYDRGQGDDVHSYVVAIAKRDTEQQVKAKLENGQLILNGGVYFTYRTQNVVPTDWLNGPFTTEGGQDPIAYVRNRDAQLYMPDLWLKLEHRSFRIELEAAAKIGAMTSRARTVADEQSGQNAQPLSILQWGGAIQGDYKLRDLKLTLGGEVGWASGDPAWGLGNQPGIAGRGPNGMTAQGDVNGPQYDCPAIGSCRDGDIRNFQFNRDYRIDLILWRSILGAVTDAIYVKPTGSYRIAEGFDVFASAIYSRTQFKKSSPSG